MEFVGETWRETAKAVWLPNRPVLKKKQLKAPVGATDLALKYAVGAAILQGRAFRGIRELQSPLSDF